MRAAVTPQQMRDLEAVAIAEGLGALILMERAAKALVLTLKDMLGDLRGKRIACYCGQGNNGGDGVAAACLLQSEGAMPLVRLLGEPATPQAAAQMERLVSLGIPAMGHPPDQVDAVLDALFGIGLNRAPQGRAAELIREINALDVPVLAADVPSGMDALTGRCYDPCVQADRTLSFQWFKTGHLLAQEPERLGTLDKVNIGIFIRGVQPLTAAEPEDLMRLLPPRRRGAHKGDHGRMLMYAGRMGSAGAAALAAQGALRAGAGLVTIACEPELIPILQVLVPNAQCVSIEQALLHPPRHDVLLAGCGLGQEEPVLSNLRKLYQPDLPAVLDADALNLLAEHPMHLGDKTLLTPHAAEAARLLKCSTQDIIGDMLLAASELSQQRGCAVLLKSHASVICKGEKQAINTAGSPVLAKGGSGDALAGIAAGLMAQGQPAFEAAQAAALWLGSAAQLAEERYGPFVPLTGDVLMLMGELTR